MLTHRLATRAIFLVIACGTLGFTADEEIDNCFITFQRTGGLVARSLDRLPEESRGQREVMTEQGDVQISRIDGYRILYADAHDAVFVNQKVELSRPESYAGDRAAILDHLTYLSAHEGGPEGLVKMGTGRYEIFGFSKPELEGNIQGIYAMFPKKNVVVYFYFNNLGPNNSVFENIDEYRQQRDIFLVDYVTHLQRCLGE